ncbi:hypothetical protein [Arthrobacter sp. FW306-04-A]|uniref:hypothetical protein n=1 Tax=Arthrobacter sp. FW306-04-A TaxID=2879619 RepID=UPI0037C16DC1|nr:hypothetical protein LFT43_09475 [Arthrobacter sp. FW306-04-A]
MRRFYIARAIQAMRKATVYERVRIDFRARHFHPIDEETDLTVLRLLMKDR